MEHLKTTISDWLSRRSPAREIPFLLFCATCLQLAFLHPYLVLIPGERANLFSGLLCALALGAACLAGARTDIRRGTGEVPISLALGMLMILSGFASLTPGSSSLRGLVVLASGLGGFWCARNLLDTESRRRAFVWLCFAMLGGILLLSLISYHHAGNVYHFLDPNPHPLATKVLLLWFAPLTLLFGGSRLTKAAAALLILVSYLVFYLSALRSAVLIPLALCMVVVLFRRSAIKYILSVAVVLLIVIIYFFHHLPEYKIGKEYEPAYYRVENYPFSWHIATKYPFLGIGLRAPRDELFKDYEIKYPHVTREKFLDSVTTIRSSENIFLTFMAEVGLPFLLLYLVAIFIVLRRLLRRIDLSETTGALNAVDLRTKCYKFPPSGGIKGGVTVCPFTENTPPAPLKGGSVWLESTALTGALPSVALFLPLTAALLHCLVFDALLHPQVNWFFHILLGLIPSGSDVEEAGIVSRGVGLGHTIPVIPVGCRQTDEGEVVRLRRTADEVPERAGGFDERKVVSS
ncbi:MAG: O-antigen ligase family protein [Syntrophobacteraceae bacterium]